MNRPKLFVKPAPDAKVRHEITCMPLAERGAWWEDTPYVRRRLREGDLILATPPAPRTAIEETVQPAIPAPVAKTTKRANRGSQQKKD